MVNIVVKVGLRDKINLMCVGLVILVVYNCIRNVNVVVSRFRKRIKFYVEIDILGIYCNVVGLVSIIVIKLRVVIISNLINVILISE